MKNILRIRLGQHIFSFLKHSSSEMYVFSPRTKKVLPAILVLNLFLCLPILSLVATIFVKEVERLSAD